MATLKAFMASHNGQTLHTIQASRMGLWAPMNRKVDASRATYVTLDGSRRDYAGVKVLGTYCDDVMVCSDGEDMTMIYFTPDSTCGDVLDALDDAGLSLPNPKFQGVTATALQRALSA